MALFPLIDDRINATDRDGQKPGHHMRGNLIAGAAITALIAAGMYVAYNSDRLLAPLAFSEHNEIVYERYEQRSPCNGVQVSHHSLLALKPIAEKRILDNAKLIIIEDPKGAGTVRINRSGNNYSYGNLFGKEKHLEQWRESCRNGFCQFNLNFYVNEYPNIERERDLTVWITGAGVAETASQTIHVHTPSKVEAPEQPYTKLDARFDGDKMVADIDMTDNDHDAEAVFQIRDDDGYHEVHSILEPGKKHQGAIAIKGKPSYAGIYVYRHVERTDNLNTENKIELADAANPFYACPASK
jgi:hypothetical protein